VPLSGRDEHHLVVSNYLKAAAAIEPSRWNQPVAPGKWSPAQLTDHLRLTYRIALGELDGGTGLRPRISWWLRVVLRLRFLPGILRTGRMPRPVMAPREVRPGDGPFDQAALITALQQQNDRFEERLAARTGDGPVLTHHLLGRFDAKTAWRFLAVHAEHHRRQLVGESAQPPH
jgi:hypothetical protein